tara:strand:+ start:158 stop:319 length:162 start_codon:yes stop_codon:yes gene_type:complete
MKKLRIRIKEIKEQLLTIKGGNFKEWYEGLSPVESLLYKIGFKELQNNNEKHR